MIGYVKTNAVIAALERGDSQIDERLFPEVLTEQLTAVGESNAAYNEAQRKEQLARTRINRALTSADELITDAKHAGQHTAKRRLGGLFGPSKKSEIEATKSNLQELINCGIRTAEAQKELVEVQTALADSQAAILLVQKTQMEYQRQTAEALKFLYLIGAQNMAATQSILINLEAVLKGASKEKLGEMARQQLLMAMDQIKNQENIMLRVRENKESIKRFDDNLRVIDVKFLELKDEEKLQNEQIKKNAADIFENSKRIIEMSVDDQVQDELIAQNADKLSVHAKKLEEMKADDDKQDELIAQNADKLSVHAKKLEEMEADDDKQDELIAQNADKLSVHAKKLEEMEADDDKQDELIAQNADKLSVHAKKLEEMEVDDDKQDQLIEDNKAQIESLISIVDGQAKEINILKDRIESIEATMSKRGWKYIVTTIASVALLIEILDILFVF